MTKNEVSLVRRWPANDSLNKDNHIVAGDSGNGPLAPLGDQFLAYLSFGHPSLPVPPYVSLDKVLSNCRKGGLLFAQL